MTYQIHPIANIFPPMSDSEFSSLKADIEQYGQREPIWLYEGKVIDGRHRLRACEELGDEPLCKVYDGFDPVAFVVSLNLHRRHMNESQRAMVGARIANLAQGARTDLAPIGGMSQRQAAKLLSVSERSVERAAKVNADCAPEVVAAVEAGHMSVSLAAQVAALPDEDEQLIVAMNEDPVRMREAARDIVHNHRAQGTGANEWYTPAEYIEAARRVMGDINLDPASSDQAQEVVQAKHWHTEEDDGLSHDWSGTVWLNPPYSQPAIQHFVEKLILSTGKLRGLKYGDVHAAILLTHNYTDTAWFQLAAGEATAICFTRGRVGFVNPEGKRASPTQGQAFFYYGEDEDLFIAEFKRFGFCVKVLARCDRDAVSKPNEF